MLKQRKIVKARRGAGPAAPSATTAVPIANPFAGISFRPVAAPAASEPADTSVPQAADKAEEQKVTLAADMQPALEVVDVPNLLQGCRLLLCMGGRQALYPSLLNAINHV